VTRSWLDRLRDLLEGMPAPRWRRVRLVMEPQLHSEWCWAACSTSVSRLFDPATRWTQCKVADAELDRRTCCQDGATSLCNKPWYLNRALRRTGNLDRYESGTVPIAAIRSQIDAGRPVGARIGWAGGGGHFVMISGCLDDATGILEVRDPIYGTSEISIASFAASYQGTGSWTHTYYTEA
jgi:hypothetical protein